ncbi:ThiF family adenylyltransferase [Inediibacterium massiliense]|uniref:ThiF family adenylyltransferase n=1 Tax=Inediibacterium massiliense TaxID=1658111 RepID=UPI0006B5A7D8|nr:ThiF family adenylyltransferase [Inediibacterium massiliense]
MKRIVKESFRIFPEISEIAFWDDKRLYNNKLYEILLSFNLCICNKKIKIIMGIPKLWNVELINFYIADINLIEYIPHVDDSGYICTFDKEGILIDRYDLKGVIKDSIYKLIDVLEKGLLGVNKVDFINEFTSYWLLLKNRTFAKSMVRLENGVKKVKYIEEKSNNYIIADKETDLQIYIKDRTVKNGIFITVKANEYIYPPDWRKELTIDFFHYFINDNEVNIEKIRNILNKGFNGERLFLFNIIQPNGVQCLIGCIFEILEKVKEHPLIDKNLTSMIENGLKFKLKPLFVERVDKTYLLDRCSCYSELIDKKVLLIGCGSVGGYIAVEIVKAGISNLTLVDDDKLNEENIFRHFLGMQYIKYYKTTALIDYINKNIPYVKMSNCEEKIQDALLDKSIELEDYDLIISATGNINVSLWLNKYIYDNDIKVPVIYVWNEPYGIGSHSLIVSKNNQGCLECLFDKDDTGIYDRSSFCAKGQNFVKAISGCGSSYTPFGSLDSIRTALLCLRVTVDFLQNHVSENMIVSIKGNNAAFAFNGYITSERYDKSQQNEILIRGQAFKNKKCMCCGGM